MRLLSRKQEDTKERNLLDSKVILLVFFCLLGAELQREAGCSLGSFLPQTTDNASSGSEKTAGTTSRNGTSDTYVWVGNHWIPPPGVPTYDPRGMFSVFQRHNTLWFGDSNARQDMMTMYTMLLAHNDSDIPTGALNQYINLNKGRVTSRCTTRDFSNSSVRGTIATEERFYCWQLEGGLESNGKFDLAQAACPVQVEDILHLERNESLTSMLQEYDILFADLGIWEIDRNWDCRAANNTESTLDRVEKALNAAQLLASKELTVFWKTTGGSSNHDATKKAATKNMNGYIRQWFHLHKPNHMYLVDWAQQILPRSYGVDRIEGDLAPHWGLEARTLTAQMFTHAVVSLGS